MNGAPPIRPRLLACAVALVAFVAFAPALFGRWIYDDWPLIAQNPYAHSLAHWPRFFTHDFWDLNPESHLARHLSYWRPLINASYGVDWTIGGGSPVMFHITNAVAHALVAVMVFLTLRRWVGKAVPAALAASLFAAMPAKVPNVAWIAGRTDVLCTLMMLIALAGIARRLRGKRGGLALEILGTAGAYLSKEQAVVLPAFVLIELWVAWDKPAIDLAFVRRGVRALIPQGLVAIGYLGARSVYMPIRGFDPAPRPLVDHVLSLFDAFGRFIAELVVPLDAMQTRGLIDAGGHHAPFVALGLGTVAGAGAVAVLVRRTRPGITLGIAAFFISMAPTVEMVSQRFTPMLTDRFLYLASIPLVLVLTDVLARAVPSRARLGALACALLVLGSLVIARHRASFYAGEREFADHEVELHPTSYEARRLRVDAALSDNRSLPALRFMLDTMPYVPPATKLEAAYEVADLATQVVPDLDLASLRTLDEFLGHLMEHGSHAELHLPFANVSIDLPPSAGDPALVARMNALRANLASRLGDVPRALELIGHSLDRCETCAVFVSMHALILARSGRLDDALAVLDKGETDVRNKRLAAMRAHIVTAGESFVRARTLSGPQALQANHAGLVALGQWGKAYELLLPYRDQLVSSPALAETFAGTAYRAGRSDDARAALARDHTPDEVDGLLVAWAEDMGWSP